MKNISIVSIQIKKDKILKEKFKKINSPLDCIDIVKQVIDDTDREMFITICLDTKNQINSLNIVSIGTINSTIVHPREVFKSAILSNAAGVILCHNHPTADVTPSKEDIETTKKLILASKILDIPILDHIIVGDDDYYSFAVNNLLSC